MMIDDPRLMTVLKRYPKGGERCDSTINLDSMPISEVAAALRILPGVSNIKPLLLDEYAIAYFSKRWPIPFDSSNYDYFIHRYLKKEFDSIENNDIRYPSENGPPANIPRPEGTRWIYVRPSIDGNENYSALYEDEI
jgi:hypothetical protein